MIEALLKNLSSTDVIAILIVIVGGYFGIRNKSLKNQLTKEAARAERAESDLRLSELKKAVDAAREKTKSARERLDDADSDPDGSSS